MNSRYITTQISRPIGITNWDTIKVYFYVLIVISILGILGPIPVSNKVQNESSLSDRSFLALYSLNINNSTKQSYALLENGEDNDFSVKDSQVFSKLFAVAIGPLILSSINLQQWENLFNEIRSFSYIFSFSSLPLRSPPLFF